GRYADPPSKRTPAEQRRFKAEHPKPEMFTKTDLAKFEKVWDAHPRWVNVGSQKNFWQYTNRVGRGRENASDGFNEFYFKRAVARGIVFRATERIVSAQPWYKGGYRANIVVYTLALFGDITKQKKEALDFLSIWNTQSISPVLESSIAIVSKVVYED